jgi:indolepyruvate ferredoxin oxidoreductase alpha subunit
MIPAYARPAHRRLRHKLGEIAAWNETSGPNRRFEGGTALGIIASGVAFMHAREAAPESAMLKLGMTYPVPVEAIRAFTVSIERCMVIEEGDPYLADAIRAAGIPVEPWHQVVADAAVGRTLIAIAGTHGKSTTAGWLVHVLAEAGA